METDGQQNTPFIQVSGLQSIKTKIIFFALLATIIPSLTLGILSYVQNRKLLRNKIANELYNTTTQTAGEVEFWLKARLYDLKVFSSSYIVSENLQRVLGKQQDNIERLVALDRVKAYLQSVRQKFTDYPELILVNMIGESLVSSGTETPVVNLPDQWFQQLEEGKPVIGTPYWDPSLKRRVVVLAEEIKSPDNKRLGILATKTDLASLVNILKRKASGNADEIYLTDAKGNLIATSASSFDRSSRSVLAAKTLTTGTGFSRLPVEYDSHRGQTVVGLGAIIPSTDWAVVAEMEKSGAYADIVRLGTWTILIVCVLLMAMGLFAYLLGHSIVKPLQRLSGEAGKVASGDLKVDLPVHGNTEVSYLTQVFNHMVASLRRGQEEISQAHEALIEKNRELHRISITDSLTGIFNRKHVMDLFDMEFIRTQRYGIPFSVLIADLDHFKEVNDTYGHLAGDSVLRSIAKAMVESVRACDHVGRYGGEEFVVVLPNTEIDGAMEMAERIRQTIRRVTFNNDGEEFSMTISMGVAVCQEDDKSVETILKRADDALYRAKADGRDQVIGP
ncbi:diguanylate cyclase [Breoghania sp.]|uniref:sensor domain-containing diguanylate cyclase n=1 Tax=Breoghania sp. TaxID=2065378 RepID=UPI0029C78291|nr:diguanylate cyclase [Breoghania sp.]